MRAVTDNDVVADVPDATESFVAKSAGLATIYAIMVTAEPELFHRFLSILIPPLSVITLCEHPRS